MNITLICTADTVEYVSGCGIILKSDNKSKKLGFFLGVTDRHLAYAKSVWIGLNSILKRFRSSETCLILYSEKWILEALSADADISQFDNNTVNLINDCRTLLNSFGKILAYCEETEEVKEALNIAKHCRETGEQIDD